jgi:hypothetical protein
MNRRIRFRTYGGVRGRGPKGPLLLDLNMRNLGRVKASGLKNRVEGHIDLI